MNHSSYVLAAEFSATTTYSNTQYLLLLFGFVVAAFALFATGLYCVKTTGEVSKAYRASTVASACICWVATIAYAVLIVEWVTEFSADDSGLRYTPDPGAVVTELRYMDWTVTVPLLTVELIAVAALARKAATRLRAVAVGAAIAMIVTGFLGVIFGQDALRGADYSMWKWGAISTVFFLVIYVVAAQAYRATSAQVGAETRRTYAAALTLLLVVFLAYPFAYCVPWWAHANNPGWAVTEQLVFTVADIVAKAGFGLLIHKVAKLRTAEDAASSDSDVRAATNAPDGVPSQVWVSGELISVPQR